MLAAIDGDNQTGKPSVPGKAPDVADTLLVHLADDGEKYESSLGCCYEGFV